MSNAGQLPGLYFSDELGSPALLVPSDPDPPAQTTLGQVMTALDDLGLAQTLVDHGLEGRPAIDIFERNHYRDCAIARASRRWSNDFRPLARDYVPGDVCGLRASAYQFSMRVVEHIGAKGKKLTKAQLGHATRELALGAWMYDAVPYFLPVSSAVGISGSYPPDDALLADLRLPFPRVAIYFAADLTLPAGLHGDDHLLLSIARQVDDVFQDDDGRFRADRYPPSFIHSPQRVLANGGEVLLAGVVFAAGPDGGIDDLVLWLTVVPDDPHYPRRLCAGWLSRANARPLALNLAAAIAWGDWHPPATDLDLPEPDTSAFRKAIRRSAFRRREPHGAAAGVRVLDARRMEATNASSGDSHASPVTHMRRGHWRRQRVGPRDDWRYERRFIPPVVVNPGHGGDNTLTVYRLPLPPSSN